MRVGWGSTELPEGSIFGRMSDWIFNLVLKVLNPKKTQNCVNIFHKTNSLYAVSMIFRKEVFLTFCCSMHNNCNLIKPKIRERYHCNPTIWHPSALERPTELLVNFLQVDNLFSGSFASRGLLPVVVSGEIQSKVHVAQDGRALWRRIKLLSSPHKEKSISPPAALLHEKLCVCGFHCEINLTNLFFSLIFGAGSHLGTWMTACGERLMKSKKCCRTRMFTCRPRRNFWWKAGPAAALFCPSLDKLARSEWFSR